MLWTIRGQPIICGGFLSGHILQNSFVIEKSQISRKMNLLQARAYASSISLSSNAIWVVGGRDRDNLRR